MVEVELSVILLCEKGFAEVAVSEIMAILKEGLKGKCSMSIRRVAFGISDKRGFSKLEGGENK